MLQFNTRRKIPVEKNFFALGTFNNITVFDSINERLIKSAVDRVLEIDEKMSAFRPDSEISMLNRKSGGEFQKVSEDTFHLLKRSVEISRASAGAFDITTRPLIELWGIGKKGDFVPTARKISDILPLVDYRDLVLDTKSCAAALKRPGQAVDLGGIAKGYAADEVKRILASGNVKNALINLGGNIVAMGCRPDGQLWNVGVQNPLAQRGEYLGVLAVKDKTIVTSGSNEKFFIKSGVRYHHILDPRTGAPAQNSLLSVTAVCNCSTDADALTTAFFVLGPQKGALLLEAFGAEAIFVTEDMKIFATGSLAKKFSLY